MHAVTPTDTEGGPRCCECAMPLVEAAAWPQSTTFMNCPSCRMYLRIRCTAGRWSVERAGRAVSFSGAPHPVRSHPGAWAAGRISQRLLTEGFGVEPGMAELAEAD